MPGDPGVCPEIKKANIPLGARLSFINGTKITTLAQARRLIRTSPRPVAICFEFLCQPLLDLKHLWRRRGEVVDRGA